jgi:hypothetical protein
MSNLFQNQLVLGDGRTLREHLEKEGMFDTPIDMRSCDPQLGSQRVSVEEFEASRA